VSGLPFSHKKHAASWPDIDKNYIVLFFLFIILGCLIFIFKVDFITSDGSNYVAYLRSLFFDGDLNFQNEFARFDQAFWDTYRPKQTVTGNYTNVFSVGPAVLWAPFYLAAHLLVVVSNLFGAHFTADGFSAPYGFAINLASLFYTFLGMCLVYKLSRKYFSRGSSLLATITGWLGTFIVYYSLFKPYMSHAVSFFTTTLFIYYWDRTREGRTGLQWAILGLWAALMMLVRWQNGLMMIFPAIESLMLYVKLALKRNWPGFAGLMGKNLLFLVFLLIGFFPQMAAWKVIYGSFFIIPQGTGFLRWTEPFMPEVLFSSRHGLYSWTPVVYLSTIGWAAFFRRDKLFAFCGLVSFILMTYTNSVVSDWWAGWGFGMRRFDGFIPIIVLGLALVLDRFKHFSFRAPFAVGIIVFMFFSFYNFFLINNLAKGKIHPGRTVAFNQILGLNEEGVYKYTGYPFSFPANLVFSLKYKLPASRYDTLVGGYIDDPKYFGTVRTAEDPVTLGRGWSNPLVYNEVNCRSIQGTAVMYAPVRTVTDFALTVRSAGKPGNGPVSVFLNGQEIGSFNPDSDWREHRFKLSKKALHKGINILEFRIKNPGTAAVESLKFTRLEYLPDWR